MTKEDASKYARARATYAVVWAKLIQQTQKPGNDVVFVFEGKDDLRYYLSRIESHFGKYPDRVVVANGKENVLKLRGDVKKTKGFDQTTAFFVDRDFDRLQDLSGETTYVTPTYSIENFFSNPKTIERFLTEEMQLVDYEDTPDREKAVSLYVEWLNLFSHSILPHCVWLKLNAEKILLLAETERKNLKDDFLSRIVNVRWLNGKIYVDLLLAAHMLHTIYPDFHPFTENELQVEMAKYKSEFNDASDAVRGKFLLPFLKIALANLIEDSNRRENRNIFSKRRRCVVQITEVSLMPTLARTAHTPNCLKEFLIKLNTLCNIQNALQPN